jgi:hypothetical protein
MKTYTAILSASLAALAAAAPTPTTNKRSTTTDCAQYGSTTAGSYVVNNDLWGESNGSGSQCYTVDGVSSGSLSWGTTWSWSNNANDVKSYANAIVNFSMAKLSDITSLKSSWDWSYTGSDIVADVSYDLFTNSQASTTSEEYEIMIWLGRYGTAGTSIHKTFTLPPNKTDALQAPSPPPTTPPATPSRSPPRPSVATPSTCTRAATACKPPPTLLSQPRTSPASAATSTTS